MIGWGREGDQRACVALIGEKKILIKCLETARLKFACIQILCDNQTCWKNQLKVVARLTVHFKVSKCQTVWNWQYLSTTWRGCGIQRVRDSRNDIY